MPVKIGYWSLRGLCSPIRYLLEYVGEEYEDVRYKAKDDWFGIKFEMGLDFPNVPWMEDGDVKISQSGAILRYLAEKHGLHGTDLKERGILEMLACEAMDFHMAYARVVYNPDFENLKEGLQDSQMKKMEQFETFLGVKNFFGGEKPKFPDFHLYEILSIHMLLFPEFKSKFPKIVAYLQRFEELPKIKAHMESDKFIKAPINGPSAKWNISP